MKGFEDFKSFLVDRRDHIVLGKVVRVTPARDKSALYVLVSAWPDEREILATMTWPSVGMERGDIDFPNQDDMVLIAFADGDDDQAFIIKTINSAQDKLPDLAMDGDKVSISKKGKKYYIGSDELVSISRGENEATERLVLGEVFKSLYSNHLSQMASLLDQISSLLTAFESHTHQVTAVGSPTEATMESVSSVNSQVNTIKSTIEGIKNNMIDNGKFLSDLVKVEK